MNIKSVMFAIFIIMLLLFVGLFFAYKKLDKKNPLIGILKSLIVSCGAFLLVGWYTCSIQDNINQENYNLTKKNEPLILKTEPILKLLDNGKGKLRFKVSQGTITKKVLVLFGKDGKVSYIPIHFNNNEDVFTSASFDIPSKNLNQSKNVSKNAIVNIKQKGLLRFGLVLKDSKGNITSYYYIIRPKVESKSYMKLEVSTDGKTYSYNQKCDNISKSYTLSNMIIGSNTTSTDVSNVMSNLDAKKSEFTNYGFHIARKNNRKIAASKFKSDNGETLQSYAVSGKKGIISSDPIVYLDYNIPSEKEIRQNIEVLDNIIKDF